MITGSDFEAIGEAINAVEEVAGRRSAYDFGNEALANLERAHTRSWSSWFIRAVRKLRYGRSDSN